MIFPPIYRFAFGIWPAYGMSSPEEEWKMRNPLFFGLVFFGLMFCVGCASKPNQVEFIIPNGFHGTIILKYDRNSPALQSINGRYVVGIPESGVLSFGGYDPFVSYLCTAKFANGHEIWVSKRLDDRPNPEQIGLFGGYAHLEGDGKVTKTVDLRYFIGTEEQWKNAKD